MSSSFSPQTIISSTNTEITIIPYAPVDWLMNKQGCPATDLKPTYFRNSTGHLYHSLGADFDQYKFLLNLEYFRVWIPGIRSGGKFVGHWTYVSFIARAFIKATEPSVLFSNCLQMQMTQVV